MYIRSLYRLWRTKEKEGGDIELVCFWYSITPGLGHEWELGKDFWGL